MIIINAGKNVVTANKALIAQYMPEIQELLKANPSVKFCYEAAVCGGSYTLIIISTNCEWFFIPPHECYLGIPVIHALHSDFLGDDITNVMGIMNGTTNFMLCKMEDDGMFYMPIVFAYFLLNIIVLIIFYHD